MDLKQQILIALGLNKVKSLKLEFQAKTEDGTIIVSSAADLEAGADVSVLTEDGTTIPLPIGTYILEDGVSFVVEEEGVVASVVDAEAMAEATDECPNGVDEDGNCIEDEEKTEAAEVEDWEGMEKRIQNLEDAVATLKGEVEMNAEDGEPDEDCPNGYDEEGNCIEDEAEEEEMSRPAKTPRTIKTTEVQEFKKLKKEFAELKDKFNNSAAGTDLNTNKFSGGNFSKPTEKELSNMSSSERFLYKINK